MSIVLYADKVRPEVTTHIEGVGDIVVARDMAQLSAAMAGATALVIQDPAWSVEVAALAGAAKSLRWVQLLTSGFDRVARFGAPPGVTITNARGAFSHSVAVHGVTMCLALQRGVPAILAQQRHARWERGFSDGLATPAESTVLVVGFGSIGQEIARLMKAFGAHIVGVSRSGRAHELADEMLGAEEARAALSHADAIFLSLPLDDGTRRFIDAAALASCKRTAVLVNVARGGLIDQSALDHALRSGIIAGAGLDVTDPEPLPADHPLWSAPNLILSPHVGGASGAAGYRSQAQIAIDNIGRFRAGAPLANIVTP